MTNDKMDCRARSIQEIVHDMHDMHDADDNCKNFSSTPLVLLSCVGRRRHALVLQPSSKTGASSVRQGNAKKVNLQCSASLRVLLCAKSECLASLALRASLAQLKNLIFCKINFFSGSTVFPAAETLPLN